MLTKSQLLQSAIAIGMTMGALTSSLVSVLANPSPTGDKPISAPQPVPSSTTPAPNNSPAVDNSPAGKIIKVETVSGKAEIALAEYLAAKGIEFYGAYWCSHCQEQKSLFGADAAAKLAYIECAADGENSQRQLCKEKDIKYFPTWVIGGKYLTGTKDLKELAKLTGYKGSMKFKYRKK
jgi:glutaredoxin